MTVQIPRILIEGEERGKFRASVYGKEGWASRDEVRNFALQVIKDAFANHNVKVTMSNELQQTVTTDGQV